MAKIEKIEFIRRALGDDVTTRDDDGVYLFEKPDEAMVVMVGTAAMSWEHGQVATAVGDLLGGSWKLVRSEPLELGGSEQPLPGESPRHAKERYARGFWSVLLQKQKN